MSLGLHYAEGEDQEMVEDSKEEKEEGLEYATEKEPSNPFYTTPPSTRGCSSPSTHVLSRSLTLEGSDPETNRHL